MNILTLLGLLVGHRASIVAFAHSPHTVWLGAVVAVVMGLAHSHDQADLTRHPWRIGVFALGTFVGATLLFLLVNEVFGRRPWREGWERYPAFVGLVALLGLWELPVRLVLAAVPTSEWAVRLSLVCIQMFLLARVLLVLTNLWPGNVVGTLLFAGMLHELLAFFLHEMFGLFPDVGPLWGIFGEFPQSQFLDLSLVRLAHINLVAMGGLLLMVGPIFAFAGRPPYIWADLPYPQAMRPTTGLLVAALLGLLVWVPVLATTQPAWQRASAINQALRQRDFATTAALLRETPRDALPARWYLGHQAALERDFDLFTVPLALWREPLPPWAHKEVEALLSLLFRKVRIGERSSPKGYDWSRVDDAFWFEMHHHPWIQNWLRQPDPPEGLLDPERHNRQWMRDLPKRWAKP